MTDTGIGTATNIDGTSSASVTADADQTGLNTTTAATGTEAAGSTADSQQRPTTGFASLASVNILNYPRVDGSTAAIPLGEALAHAALGMSREECSEYANFSGTTSSYASLIDGKVDLLLVYEPAPQTLELKAERGFEWKMAPIGRDALIFIVNNGNPVVSLTAQQLKGIYTGEILNWNELGGEDRDIMPYQRNSTAGSQTLMEKLVMAGEKMANPPVEFTITSMEGLIQAIASYNNSLQAIGYSVYYYAHNMKPDDGLRFMAVNGVEPSNSTIQNGTYPFVSDFYAVIRADEPTGSPAHVLFDFMTSDDGQAIAAREGYVPVK
jgi:phosphate transport system substrate-binding protein